MNPDLHRALRCIDLKDLHTYARARLKRCGWAGSDDEERSVTSAEDLVETAIQLALEGTRVWDPSTVDINGFLRGVIRSLVSAERKRYVRARTLTSSELVELHSGTIESVEDALFVAARDLEVNTMVEACIDGDAELGMLWAAILDGHTKREDLAEALGWQPSAVTAARIKLQRRLVQHASVQFAMKAEKRQGTSQSRGPIRPVSSSRPRTPRSTRPTRHRPSMRPACVRRAHERRAPRR